MPKYCRLCERLVEPKRVIHMLTWIFLWWTCIPILMMIFDKRCPICNGKSWGKPNPKEIARV